MINRNQVEAAIAVLETHGDALGDEVVSTSLAVLQERLARLGRQETVNAALRGERKQVTVMFADISGFTAMSENLDPEEVRNLINACFERLGAVVKRYDGYIDKFIGDEIMALFGAPIAHENDPERALRAALDMMSALEEFNAKHADKIPKPLALHFGINTGLVIAGGIGTQERQDYSVLGDTVNLAARLEALSETGEILVGPTTYRLTAPLFDFEPLPPVKVKGKERPVLVYRLLRATVRPGQVRGIEGLTSPLVGRKDELAQLHAAMSKLEQGCGGVISVTGEVGLGKSRLVQEFYQSTQDDQVVWAKGRALSYGQNASYLITRDILCGVFGLAAEDSATKIGDALQAEIRGLFPERFLEIYPYLAYLLEIPLDGEAEQRIKYLAGEALQKRIVQAVQGYIRAKAQQNPLVLTWDDLHWADPSSLGLLKTLLPLTQTCPLLVLLVYRPVRDSRVWAFHKRLGELTENRQQYLELPPLTSAESHQLVSNLIGDNEQTRNIRQLIVRKAEGNPFYVEEVIRSLIDNGTLVWAEDNGHCITATNIPEITIPDTLQGVIMARIDQLNPEAKRTLQIASVIGRTFQQQVLAQVIEKLNA